MNLRLSTISATLMLSLGSALATVPDSQTISTELNEVRTGQFDGIDYLDLYITRHVGPATCRNNIVSIDVNRYTEKNRANIEVLALSAVVKSDQVLLTIPLASDSCVDGKPLVSDLQVLPELPVF